MAVTYRNIMNRVLRVLSEDEVEDGDTELLSQYHKLVGLFVNQIKEEIEDAHNWRIFLTQHTATVTASTNVATIVGSNERSRLLREHDAVSGQLIPAVYDVTDASNPIPLREMSLGQIVNREAMDTQTANEPSFFSVTADADGEEVRITVYPTPSTTRTLAVAMFTPQPRMADDELDTIILIPARVLELGAMWYALEERGEELGVNNLFTEERFRKALDDAIARDAEEQGGFQLVVV